MKLLIITVSCLLSSAAFATDTQLDQDLSTRLYNSLRVKAIVGPVFGSGGVPTIYAYQKDIDGKDSDIRCSFSSEKLNARPSDEGSSPVRCFIREFPEGHD